MKADDIIIVPLDRLVCSGDPLHVSAINQMICFDMHFILVDKCCAMFIYRYVRQETSTHPPAWTQDDKFLVDRFSRWQETYYCQRQNHKGIVHITIFVHRPENSLAICKSTWLATPTDHNVLVRHISLLRPGNDVGFRLRPLSTTPCTLKGI